MIRKILVFMLASGLVMPVQARVGRGAQGSDTSERRGRGRPTPPAASNSGSSSSSAGAVGAAAVDKTEYDRIVAELASTRSELDGTKLERDAANGKLGSAKTAVDKAKNTCASIRSSDKLKTMLWVALGGGAAGAVGGAVSLGAHIKEAKKSTP